MQLLKIGSYMIELPGPHQQLCSKVQHSAQITIPVTSPKARASFWVEEPVWWHQAEGWGVAEVALPFCPISRHSMLAQHGHSIGRALPLETHPHLGGLPLKGTTATTLLQPLHDATRPPGSLLSSLISLDAQLSCSGIEWMWPETCKPL